MDKKNVGGIDHKMRMLLGAGLLGLGAGRMSCGKSGGAAGVAAGIFGLFTSALEYCPLNDVMGLDSRPGKGETLLDRLPSTRSRVPRNTAPSVNGKIHHEMTGRIEHLKAQGPDAIERRLEELEAEWDIERAIEAESAANVLLCLALGRAVSSRFNYLPLGIGAMVLTHGLHGWYPMLPLFRRLGLRTATEIYAERNLLKAARGDFKNVSANGKKAGLDEILEAVRR